MGEEKNNLFHSLPSGPNPPQEVYCLIEIPAGARNKYEYDKNLGVFILDRAIYGTNVYPTEYGFIPQTWSREDEDPLDIMVVSSFPTFPGCLVAARPIGLLKMIDTGEQDHKIISVASCDPRFEHVLSLENLGPHFQKEIKNFWESYVVLQPGKKIEVAGWEGAESSRQMIKQALQDYQQTFG